MGLKDPEKVKEYKAYVRLIAAEKLKSKNGTFPTRLPVILHLTFYFPIPRSWSKKRQNAARSGQIKHTNKPDVDNLVKAIKDALNGLVWHDDSQIVYLFAKKEYSETPGVAVRFSLVD